MVKFLIDEINERLASMTEADLVEPTQAVGPDDKMMDGVMDDHHRKLFSLMCSYGAEADRLHQEAFLAIIGGHGLDEYSKALVKKALICRAKSNLVRDLLYTSLIIAYDLADKPCVVICVGWRVGYCNVSETGGGPAGEGDGSDDDN